MHHQKRFDVDGAMAEISLEEAATRCGVQLHAQGSGTEVRIDCPFGCDGDHAGRYEISVNTTHPAKLWKCHAYGCQMRGNLLNLMHGWINGGPWSGQRLHGEEFKSVKQALMTGTPPAHSPTPLRTPDQVPAPETKPTERKRNVPLIQSPDPRTRSLMEPPLYEKLVTDVTAMSPAVSAYVRRHPCLSSEAMQKWNVGVMPSDGGGDKRGFSLRGNVIYTFRSETGDVLGFVGRDVAYDRKEQEFKALSAEQRKGKRAPIKHRFPKSFARGIELYGQQAERLKEPGYRERIARYGLVICEGFNDVINLDTHGIPALGICSNHITAEQVEKVANWSRQLAAGKVVLLLDCEDTGDDGARDAAWQLLERGLDVRLGWSQAMHGGAFRGRQPESLTETELQEVILPALEKSRGVRVVSRER